MQRNIYHFVRLLLLSTVLLLSACQTGYAPVSSVGERGKYHIVEKGDTLYSIAWRYGKDFKSLAASNRIKPPYTIFIGQKIHIRGKGKDKAATSKAVASKKVSKPRKIARAQPVLVSSKVKWQWPVKGEILSPFTLSGKVNKGINIAGKLGAPVHAAASGVVVYAGGNLRGYGKLVIVKHDDNFLSAYGNNSRIRVKEGEHVSAGQTLAEIGATSANVPMLHFEVRRKGKPEDPTHYLPK